MEYVVRVFEVKYAPPPLRPTARSVPERHVPREAGSFTVDATSPDGARDLAYARFEAEKRDVRSLSFTPPTEAGGNVGLIAYVYEQS